MEEINYIGEHLWAGQLGKALVMVSFVFSLAAMFLYARYTSTQREADYKTARLAFSIHSLGVFGMVGLLFYMLLNHFFEYHYIWQHSNREMPLRYIFSCFWEGQEGSFLLWIFWNVILGNVLLRKSGQWEAPVMTFFSSIQVFLTSMLLGIYLGDVHIGSNPFTMLLREHPDFAQAPIFTNAEYLLSPDFDGRGLNPLLQNYWMTIHPPTLFLGFALTSIPFCYALAALWKKQWNEWIQPALPWTFFGVAVLGTGILMGGAWAYEALSFGGFWAWDPVENASLVPWILLVAGAHTLLIQKAKKTALFSSFILILSSFIFVLYSTFLTRSGILGEASVHSFTDLGLSGQLLLYLLFYVVLAVSLLFYRRKSLTSAEEESVFSREFWMFIGSMILLVSALQISFSTSIPVINKLIALIPGLTEKVGKLAPPSDVMAHYHQFQIPIAIVLALVIAGAQFMKYGKTDFKTWISKLWFPMLISLLVSIFLILILPNTTQKVSYFLLLFTSFLAVFSNIAYFKQLSLPKAGSAIAHIGFGLILVGSLISQGYQQVISQNTSQVDVQKLGEKLTNKENILIYQNDTLPMGKYWVSYGGKKQEGINILFQVDYFTRNEKGTYLPEFTLYPRVQTNPKMGSVSEPDTRHFIEQDIYTHVTYAVWDEAENQDDQEYISEPKVQHVHERDTFFTSNAMVYVESVHKALDNKEMGLDPNDIAVGLFLNIQDMSGNRYSTKPIYVINPTTGTTQSIAAEVDTLGLKFVFQKINTHDFSFDLAVFEKKANIRDFIVMKAVTFPGINVLWAGCILMVMGIFVSIRQRLKTRA